MTDTKKASPSFVMVIISWLWIIPLVISVVYTLKMQFPFNVLFGFAVGFIGYFITDKVLEEAS